MSVQRALLAAVSIGVLAAAILPAAASPVALDLGPFSAASIGTAIEARIVVGETQSVEIDVNDPAMLEDLKVDVVNGVLRAWIDSDFWDAISFRDNTVRLTVSMPALRRVAATSAAHVVILGVRGEELLISADSAARVELTDLAVASLLLDVDSAAQLVVSGTCGRAVARVHSVARVDAGALKCTDLNVDATSASNSRFTASGNVEARATSAANVKLMGRPASLYMDTDSAGGIDVIE